MTPEQQNLLRFGLESLMPLPKSFGMEFYERLFALDPALKDLFRGDAERQASMLAEALTTAVVHLIDEGKISDSVRRLGVRHRGYGLLDRDWETFGKALLETFEHRLRGEFTPEVRAAWSEAWDQVAATMQTAKPDDPERA